MKKLITLMFAVLVLGTSARAVEVAAPSALLMEKETGTILFAKDEHNKLEPASVTKVMTILLTMEAIDSGQLSYDTVVTVMSRELILNHPDIRQYTTIWMDTLRDGTSQLVNTNKLVRFYEGATGLKTGSTDSALYCLSGTAERDGMELIAVIMKDATSAQRFEDAKALLSYGFSTYTLKKVLPETPLAPVPVELGTQATVQPVLGDGGTLLLEKSSAGDLQQTVTLADSVSAPVARGDQLGTLTVTSGEKAVAEIPLLAGEEVPRITYGQMLLRLLRTGFLSD